LRLNRANPLAAHFEKGAGQASPAHRVDRRWETPDTPWPGAVTDLLHRLLISLRFIVYWWEP